MKHRWRKFLHWFFINICGWMSVELRQGIGSNFEQTWQMYGYISEVSHTIKVNVEDITYEGKDGVRRLPLEFTGHKTDG